MYTAYVEFVKDLKRNKSDVVKTTGLFFFISCLDYQFYIGWPIQYDKIGNLAGVRLYGVLSQASYNSGRPECMKVLNTIQCNRLSLPMHCCYSRHPH